MRRDRLVTAGLVLGGVLVGAVAAELLLRAYVRYGGDAGTRLAEHDPLHVQVEPLGTVGYKQRPGSAFRYYNGTVAHANSLGYRGPEITVDKPKDVLRVVLLGGSTTHGWGVHDTATIDAFMRRRLASERSPRYEIINAAMDGYDSRQILERISNDVLRLDPDILIINGGINDVRNARFPHLVEDDPRTLLWGGTLDRMRREAIQGRSWWTTAKHHSLLLRLPGYLAAMRSQQTPKRDSTLIGFPEAADLFEDNLRDIVRIASAHDIRLIFATPPSSLRTRYAPGAAPEKSYWLGDAESTAKYRDTLAARMERVASDPGKAAAPILYLRPTIPAEQFLDDAHLTAEGNAAIAAVFSEAVRRIATTMPAAP
ncbi:MAG TPA: GDSL-type esterase/lipase family protein [Gemmatimonadaceae bacterium]|nr:GDSL-type esterase/lipase family protein [Gemmatimonadaceae bacterium]